jgi:hypothetical protein
VIFCIRETPMTASRAAKLAFLLRGVASLFAVLAVLAFWVGGRAISEFAKTDRVLAEMEGVALTALFSGLGVIAKATADRIDENEGNISLTESLRHSSHFIFPTTSRSLRATSKAVPASQCQFEIVSGSRRPRVTKPHFLRPSCRHVRRHPSACASTCLTGDPGDRYGLHPGLSLRSAHT